MWRAYYSPVKPFKRFFGDKTLSTTYIINNIIVIYENANCLWEILHSMVQLVWVHMYLVECMLLVVFVSLADYMLVQLILFSDAQDQNVRCWALKCGPGIFFTKNGWWEVPTGNLLRFKASFPFWHWTGGTNFESTQVIFPPKGCCVEVNTTLNPRNSWQIDAELATL